MTTINASLSLSLFSFLITSHVLSLLQPHSYPCLITHNTLRDHPTEQYSQGSGYTNILKLQ
jgi:hypothetical protein